MNLFGFWWNFGFFMAIWGPTLPIGLYIFADKSFGRAVTEGLEGAILLSMFMAAFFIHTDATIQDDGTADLEERIVQAMARIGYKSAVRFENSLVFKWRFFGFGFGPPIMVARESDHFEVEGPFIAIGRLKREMGLA